MMILLGLSTTYPHHSIVSKCQAGQLIRERLKQRVGEIFQGPAEMEKAFQQTARGIYGARGRTFLRLSAISGKRPF